MKALVTGVAGQLGHDVMNELAKRNIAGVGTDLKEVYSGVMDGTPVTTMPYIEEMPEACRKVNAYGTLNIAKVCEELDIPMMYFSTDYVFNGNGTRPWEPEDAYEPLDVYGQTKAEGEVAVREHVKKFFILRIAWVFGVNGKNFIKTMLNLAKNHTRISQRITRLFGS